MDSQTSDRRSIVRNSSRLTVLTMLSRILGLAREMVKASFLGTSGVSDAFAVAFVIPNLLRRLFAEGSIAVAFVPAFKGYLMDGDRKATKEFLSSVFTVLTFLVTLTVLVGIAATPLIVPLFGTMGDETTLLTRIMFPFLGFISLAALMQGILNGSGSFSPSGFTPILFNIVVILLTWALSPFMENPARAMAAGVVTGGAVQLLYQVPFVLKLGFRFPFMSLVRAFRNPGTRTVLKLIGPTIVGMAAYQLNEIVSTALAGHAGTGIASSLQYSLRLQELILGIFVVSIGTVMLPQLTAFAKNGNWEKFSSQLAGSINAITLITIPITVFALLSSDHIVAFLFRSRSFTAESVALTSYAFRFHLLGLFFIAQNRILAPAFYAQQDTKSPTIAGILSFGLNVVLAFALVLPMKGGGIALALSLSSLANTVFLLLFLRTRRGVNEATVLRSTGLYMLKITAFSALAAVPVILLKRPLYGFFAGSDSRLISEGVPLVLTTIAFGAVGVLCLFLSRDSQTRMLVDMVRKRGSKES